MVPPAQFGRDVRPQPGGTRPNSMGESPFPAIVAWHEVEDLWALCKGQAATLAFAARAN